MPGKLVCEGRSEIKNIEIWNFLSVSMTFYNFTECPPQALTKQLVAESSSTTINALH